MMALDQFHQNGTKHAKIVVIKLSHAIGTVIDDKVCHPRSYDFYICPHFGAIGTTRPTNYHVLMDQVGFFPCDLQELVHSRSYVYKRSTTAISVVGEIKFDDMSDGSSSSGGQSSCGNVPVCDVYLVLTKLSEDRIRRIRKKLCRF